MTVDTGFALHVDALVDREGEQPAADLVTFARRRLGINAVERWFFVANHGYPKPWVWSMGLLPGMALVVADSVDLNAVSRGGGIAIGRLTDDERKELAEKLPTRLCNLLLNEEISLTVAAKMRDGNLLSLPNFGKTSLRQLRAILGQQQFAGVDCTSIEPLPWYDNSIWESIIANFALPGGYSDIEQSRSRPKRSR